MRISYWFLFLCLLLPPWPHGNAEEAEHHHEPGEAEHGEADHAHEGELELSPEVLQEFGIRLATAGPGRVAVTAHLTGEVVIAPDRLYHVVPQVSGIVREAYKEVGDKVEAGDLLAILASRELAAAKAALLIAKSRLDLANANLARERQLFRKGITSKRIFLETQQAQIAASVELDAAKHRLLALGLKPEEVEAVLKHREKGDLTRYELRAPASGEVIEKHAALGEFLQSDRTAFVLADLNRVWVHLTVYQKDLPRIHPGLPVRIEAEHGIAPATGKIDYVSPVLDEQARSALARVILDNPDRRWRPGMFVSAKVGVTEKQAAVAIPASALVELEGKTIVFVQEEPGHFEPRPVRIGQRGLDRVEILSGLKAGEPFIAQGAFLLKSELGKGSMDSGHHH